MKPLFILFLVCVSLAGYAQTPPPAKEFTVGVSASNVEIAANETREIEITILRSKSYLKGSTVMGLSSSLPKGIDVVFSPDKGEFETTRMIIKASEVVAPGQYSLIVNATLRGKTKASIVKLNVTGKTIASDGKQ
jgi:hypothetical protein